MGVKVRGETSYHNPDFIAAMQINGWQFILITKRIQKNQFILLQNCSSCNDKFILLYYEKYYDVSSFLKGLSSSSLK